VRTPPDGIVFESAPSQGSVRQIVSTLSAICITQLVIFRAALSSLECAKSFAALRQRARAIVSGDDSGPEIHLGEIVDFCPMMFRRKEEKSHGISGGGWGGTSGGSSSWISETLSISSSGSLSSTTSLNYGDNGVALLAEYPA
jgi:hypothetical protein